MVNQLQNHMIPGLGLRTRLVCCVTAIALCFATHDAFASSPKFKKPPRHQKQHLSPKKIKPSISAVFDRICQSKIKFPRIVMQQVILETGWLKSEHLMSKNNLFGFRAKHYMSFKDWESSVEHYRSWQLRRLREDDRDYYKVLERIRYGAPGYVTHLKKINWSQDCASSHASGDDQGPDEALRTSLAEGSTHDDAVKRDESAGQ
jgi:hypothetical protein